MHVANLYIEMQRSGSVISNSADFMADLTQRLNIESSKVNKDNSISENLNASPGFFSHLTRSQKKGSEKLQRKGTKRNNSTDGSKPKPAADITHITQNLFSFP